ncbi:MAG TPA: ComF family protein, partial [Puia sp.]
MTSRILFFQSVLHLFFPYTCCGCGSDLITENILFCIHCQSSMPVTMFEYFESNPIEKIFWGRVQVRAAAAHLYFTSGSLVQHSLHLLKYKGRKEIGFYYGRQMG